MKTKLMLFALCAALSFSMTVSAHQEAMMKKQEPTMKKQDSMMKTSTMKRTVTAKKKQNSVKRKIYRKSRLKK